MLYYHVAVGSNFYRGKEDLTYCHNDKLKKGQLVVVPLRSKKVLGVVTAQTTQPDFALKPIEKIVDAPVLPQPYLQILSWVSSYYAAPLGVVIQHCLPASLSSKPRLKQSDNRSDSADADLPPLTSDQQAALNTILKSPARTCIVHGDTGSGKTRLYIELAAKCLQANRSAIILTPEIALTPQLVALFKAQFGSQVIVTHSALTAAQRRDLWLKALCSTTEPIIIIGPRSALFLPLSDIGLVVVDECHEPAYKNEQFPAYHAVRVASRLGQIHNCHVVLGSATPSITDYYLAQNRQSPILRLKNQAIANATPPKVSVVDLRDKSTASPHPLLSKKLVEAVAQALDRQEQSLLFLNRRGTARSILCKTCGWQALCPNCDISLTYHKDLHHIRCHTCGHQAAAPTSCPACHNSDITFQGIGTKALADMVQSIFPKARIGRYDGDTIKAEQIHNQYHKINEGSIDILIGTQVLVKGLDLPKLSVVGMILAESSLQFPDYISAERTYQLINQLIGRVGRGHRAGQAVIQTFNPDNPAIVTAIRGNWDEFVTLQLAERQQFNFPPFCHLLKLKIKGSSADSILKSSQKLIDHIGGLGLNISLHGPTPCYIEKQGSKLHWQIIIKSKNRSDLLKISEQLPNGWIPDLDPIDLL